MQKKVLARFGGAIESVPICIASAGVSAALGDPASQGARHAIRKYGLTLESHESTQVHSYMIEQADLVLVMGHRHRSVLRSQWPEYSEKIFMLAADEGDMVAFLQLEGLCRQDHGEGQGQQEGERLAHGCVGSRK